ncbi:unnamed protein product [Sympodiomycopsis kandeliae]
MQWISTGTVIVLLAALFDATNADSMTNHSYVVRSSISRLSPRGILQKAAKGISNCFGGQCSRPGRSTSSGAPSASAHHTSQTVFEDHRLSGDSHPSDTQSPLNHSSPALSGHSLSKTNSSSASSPSAHSSTYYGHMSSPSSYHPSQVSAISSAPSTPAVRIRPGRVGTGKPSAGFKMSRPLRIAALGNGPLRIGSSASAQRIAHAFAVTKATTTDKGKAPQASASGSSSSSSSPGSKVSSGAGPSGTKH